MNLSWYLKRRFNDLLERYTGMHVMMSIPRGSTKFAKGYFKNNRIKCAEVGVYKGYNSISILKELNVSEFHLVDPYIDDEEEYQEEINQWLNKAKAYAFKKINKNRKDADLFFHYQKSEDASRVVPKELDFIYIDGNHAKEFVKKDIECYWPHIKKGGILAGHDFNLQDVAQAVYEFAVKNNLTVYNHGMDWWYIK